MELGAFTVIKTKSSPATAHRAAYDSYVVRYTLPDGSASDVVQLTHTSDNQELEIDDFFMAEEVTPAIKADMRRHLKKNGTRTLSGFAMELIKNLGARLGVKLYVLHDSWEDDRLDDRTPEMGVGFGNDNRAARLGVDRNALAEAVGEHGYYAAWGFGKVPNASGHRSKRTAKALVRTNATFVPLPPSLAQKRGANRSFLSLPHHGNIPKTTVVAVDRLPQDFGMAGF